MSESQWQMLTPEEAQQRQSYGFRGWLIFIYILALLLAVWQLAGSLDQSGGLVRMYGSEENADIMRHVMLIKVLCWVPFFILAPFRHPKAQSAALICISATLLMELIVINFVLGLQVPVAMSVNAFNVLVAAGLALYFIRSKRVNLTYRLREKAH